MWCRALLKSLIHCVVVMMPLSFMETCYVSSGEHKASDLAFVGRPLNYMTVHGLLSISEVKDSIVPPGKLKVSVFQVPLELHDTVTDQ